MLRWLCVIVVIVATFYMMDIVDSCNEAVCASVVSKCMLTQSCKCDLKNCSCCKDCFSCLGDLYSECCSCVDMCPKPNDTGTALSKKSHVEDFSEPYPSLFEALTAEPDTQQRWITFTFPVDFDAVSYQPKLEKEYKYWTLDRRTSSMSSYKLKSAVQSTFVIGPHSYKPSDDNRINEEKSNIGDTISWMNVTAINDFIVESAEQEVAPMKDIITRNCTVAYMSQCMSWNKCKQSCKSTGAASYRWFHDGCCECIGEKCINYGINESRCLNCPMKNDPLSEEDGNPFNYDYVDEYEEEKKEDSPNKSE